MKKTLIIFVVLFTTLNLFSQIAADISGNPLRPVSPPYPFKGFNFANACERNFNVDWVGRIFRNTTNSCTSTLQKFNSSTLNWDVVMTNNHVAILNNPNIWRYKVTQKGTYRVVFSNVIENSVPKTGYTVNLGNVNFAYADNANFLLKYRSGTLFYSNTSYPQSNPLRICKRELFNSELNIQSLLQMYNWSKANGYSGEIGHDITLEFEDPNGQVMQVPNFQNYMQIISVAPLFDFKIFEKGQGYWFADQANQMVEDYFNQIGGAGNGNFRLTVIIENGCNQSINTESMYINVSENESPFQFSFNTNSTNSSTDASTASTQGVTIFSSCNTGLKLNISGSGTMLQGSYKIDIVSMDNTGQPNPSNILWQGVFLSGNNGAIPSEILYNNIYGASGPSLLTTIQNTPSLQGTNLFLRITVVESCDGTKVNQTEQYYKVKFNAPVTNATLDVKMLDISTNTSQQHRNWATGILQNPTIATTQSNPISIGALTGFISVKNNGGVVDKVTFKISDANSGLWIFNQNNNVYSDILNINPNQNSPGEYGLNTLYRNESTNSSLHNLSLPLADPTNAEGYFAYNNGTNVGGKTYKLEGIAASTCPNIAPVPFTIFFKCMGKFVNNVWQNGQIATRSVQATQSNISIENSLLVFEQSGVLHIKASFAEKSSFTYSLFDLSGKKLNPNIDLVKDYEAGQYHFEYNTAALTNGVYILNTIVNGEVQSQKIQLNR